MTELEAIRAEQARMGDWLRAHADWRDSAELVDVPGYGRMMKRTAYLGFLAGACDWLAEECLYLRAEPKPLPGLDLHGDAEARA